jgi:pimeloyl-ACP methyl ester carboxylesterase
MKLRHRWVLAIFLIMLAGLSLHTLTSWRASHVLPPMPGALSSGTMPVNGIEMYYAIYGHGPPILLIHGGLSNANVWQPEIPSLAAHHEVIVADSRGHGRSTWTHEALSYDQMASDYLRLLDDLKCGKVALVGWSDGGIIGLDIAIHHPERLTALFAQAANANPAGLVQHPAHTSVLAAAGHVVRSAYASILATLGRYPDLRSAVTAMWATQPNFSEAQLASIKVRTAIVIGDHDEVIRRDHTEYLAKTIPGAKLIVLPGAGHMAPVEDPSAYVGAVESFVDQQ